MLTDRQVKELLIQYPDGVNKEIFRKVCHISPRLAQHLLESQMVPCEIKPQKSHRYHIATTDMIAFIRDRERHPERYGLPEDKKTVTHNSKRNTRRTGSRLSAQQLRSLTEKDYQAACQHAVSGLPDVLSVNQVRQVIGYCGKTICIWCRKKRLVSIRVRGLTLIPRLALYDFMISDSFRTIKTKSVLHWELLSYAVNNPTPTEN